MGNGPSERARLVAELEAELGGRKPPAPRGAVRPSLPPPAAEPIAAKPASRPSIPPPAPQAVAGSGDGGQGRKSLPPPAEAQAGGAETPTPVTGRDELLRRLGEVEKRLGAVQGVRDDISASTRRLDELDEGVGGHEERIEALEQRPVAQTPVELRAILSDIITEIIDPLRQQLEGLQTTIDEAVARTLKPVLEALKAKGEELERAAKAAEGSAGAAEVAAGAAAGKAASAEGIASGLKTVIDEARAALVQQYQEAGRTLFEEVTTIVQGSQKQIDGGIDALSRRVGTVEGTLNAPDTGLAVRVGKLEGELHEPENGLAARVEALDEGLGDHEERLGAVGETLDKLVQPEGALEQLLGKIGEVATDVDKLRKEEVAELRQAIQDYHDALGEAEAARTGSREKSGVIGEVGRQAQTLEEQLAGVMKKMERVEEALTTIAGPDYEAAKGLRASYLAPLTRLVAQALVSDRYADYVKQLAGTGYGKSMIREVLLSLTIRENAEQQAAALGKPELTQTLMNKAKECAGGA